MSKYKGFTQVELRKPKRSMFDLSHESRLSTRMGRLTPIVCMEALPNDTFSVSSEVLIKLAPMIAPIFHRLNLYVHFFFVPNRLLWEDWEEFITGGRLGESVDVSPVPPHLSILQLLAEGNDLLDTGSLADYLGVPSIPDSDAGAYSEGQRLQVMPFAAMAQIYMDYYRDRNFVSDDFIVLPLPSGDIPLPIANLFSNKNRAWQHDYFTSAQTTTQRGPEVMMPLSGTGSVTYLPYSTLLDSGGGDTTVGPLSSSGPPTNELRDSAAANVRLINIDEVTLDSSEVSINEFRRAIALQQWMERNQLAGSRMNESIRAHFGRITSDSRLQRAEYLGGGKAVVKIDEVMTTAYSEDADTAVVPPANPSGRGSAYSTTNRFRYNCEEWGFIVGVLSVMPSSGYMQGLPRMFQERKTFLDYPWPTFANLGEQPVYDYEIFANAATLDPASGRTIFGYQSRYSDWKSLESSTHGDFRTSLDYWHLTRKFADLPNLDANFVSFEDALQDRIFNVSGVDTLWMYIYNQIKVVRSLPYFGVPSGLSPNAL